MPDGIEAGRREGHSVRGRLRHGARESLGCQIALLLLAFVQSQPLRSQSCSRQIRECVKNFKNFESNFLDSYSIKLNFNRRWLGAVRVSKRLLSERGQRGGGQSVLRSSNIHHFRLRDATAHVPLHRVRQRDSQISSQSNVLRYFAPYATSVDDMREQGESRDLQILFSVDLSISIFFFRSLTRMMTLESMRQFERRL